MNKDCDWYCSISYNKIKEINNCIDSFLPSYEIETIEFHSDNNAVIIGKTSNNESFKKRIEL